MTKKLVVLPTKENENLTFADLPITSKEYKEAIESMRKASAPLSELLRRNQEIMKTLMAPSFVIENTFGAIVKAQQEAFAPIFKMQEMMKSLVPDMGISKMVNMFQGLQIEAFAGLTVKADVLKSTKFLVNGIERVSDLTSMTYGKVGLLHLGFEKRQAFIGSQIVYQKVQQIETSVEILGSDMQSVKQEFALIRGDLEKRDNLLERLENNPFQYFRIKSVKYLKETSHFLVNDEIVVNLPPAGMKAKLCTVLFSGWQKPGEEWFFYAISQYWQKYIDYAEGQDLKWSQIVSAVDGINDDFQKQTTKGKFIIVERPERLRLNPAYFS